MKSNPVCVHPHCICDHLSVFVYSERGGELVEAVWTLPEKDPDLVQTAKEPGPSQQHQKVLRGIVSFNFSQTLLCPSIDTGSEKVV